MLRSLVNSRVPFRWLVSRCYATEGATSSSLQLTLVSPHETIMAKKEVYQVNIPATSGDMGVLAQHVPTIEQLRPGVIEVFTTATQKTKYFVSGGFAVVHSDSQLVINGVEMVPVDQLDMEAIKQGLTEWQRKASSASTDVDKAKAEIGVEVHQAMLIASSSSSSSSS